MSGFRDDLGRRIEELELEGPLREWLVETVDGHVLFRCHSRDEAMSARSLVVRLSREDALSLKVCTAGVTPEYIDRTGLKSADARFCDWALLQLRQVSIETSSDRSGPRFVVKNDGGQAAEGRTLAAALFGLVQCCALRETNSEKEFNRFHKSEELP
jgi:hypothetical protein